MAEFFDLNQYLVDNGLEFQGMDQNSGMPLVADKTGNARPFDVNALIQDMGQDPTQIKEIAYNQPSTAIQVSPISHEERSDMSVGNIAGNMKFLSKKFDEVMHDGDNGFSVKKDNVWYAVDPSILGKGNAWDKTKEAFKHGFGLVNNPDLPGDLADLLPDAMNAAATAKGAAAGATLGTAVFPGIGTAVGGVVGAGIAGFGSGGIRTSLGRLAGTYDATPEEQAADMGLEAILSMGGQTVALGAKPVLGQFVKAAKSIGSSASELTKDTIASVVGTMTKAGNVATRTFLDHAGEVGASITKAAKAGAGNVTKAIEHVATLKREAVEHLLETASDALPQRYGQLLDELVTSAEGKKFSIDLKSVINKTFQQLDEKGFGKTAVDAGTDVPFAGKPTQRPFSFLNEKDVADRILNGQNAELLTAEEQALLQPAINLFTRLSKVSSPLNGGAAAATLKEFEKTLNKLLQQSFKSESPAFKRVAAQLSATFKNNVGEVFEGQGLGQQYGALSQLYGQYGEAVNMGRRILNSDKGVETLANQLSSPPKKGSTSKGLRDSLVELLGKEGEAQAKNIAILNATENFLPRAPQMGIFQIAGLSGLAASPGETATKVAMGTALATASSPRFMGRAMQMTKQPLDATLAYGQKATDFLKALTPEQVKALMKNDAMFQQFIRPLATGQMMESQMKDQLVGSASQGLQAANQTSQQLLQAWNTQTAQDMRTVRSTGRLPEDLEQSIEGMASSMAGIKDIGITKIVSKLEEKGLGHIAREAKTLFKDAKEADIAWRKANRTKDTETMIKWNEKYLDAIQTLNSLKSWIDHKIPRRFYGKYEKK